MTTFIEFAKAHGVLIDYLPPIGLWKRYPTTDHPKTRNGAALFNEHYGVVRNFATMSEHATWRGQAPLIIDKVARSAFIATAKKEDEVKRRNAANKATWIIGQCKMMPHEYLANKGFPMEAGLVWVEKNLLIIPMRVGKELTSVQIISADGGKKFLDGGKTKLAAHVINNRGTNIICEGYATALSVRRALTAFKLAYTIHICFSASNALAVSRTLKQGVFIADNDKPDINGRQAGQVAAKDSGWTTWIAPDVGMDANDFEKNYGYFKLGSQLKALIMGLGCNRNIQPAKNVYAA